MKLTLLRHGSTEGNLRHLYYGRADLPLAPEGEAELLRLRETAHYPEAPHFCTSGLIRTEQTLRILYGDRPHEIIPDLREIDFGAFELRSYGELRGDPAYQRWITGDNEKNVCPGGESGEQVTARALRAIEPVLRRDEDTVCIIHGGVIAGLLAVWFPGQGDRYTLTPRPGAGFTAEFRDSVPQRFYPVP